MNVGMYVVGSGGTNLLTGMTKGDLANNYTGDKLFIRNINFQYVLRSDAANSSEQYVRIVIVRDKKPFTAGTAPILGDIFDYYGGSTPITSQSEADQSLMMYQYTSNRFMGRFTILYNKIHKLAGDADAGYASKLKKVRINVFKPWYDHSSTLVDRGMGQIYLFAWSNIFGAAPPPILNAIWRVGYTDV